jgi:hypothetical protein
MFCGRPIRFRARVLTAEPANQKKLLAELRPQLHRY